MGLETPLAGYSFDASTVVDDVGARDFASWARSYAAALLGNGLFGNGAAGTAGTAAGSFSHSPPYSLAVWIYMPAPLGSAIRFYLQNASGQWEVYVEATSADVHTYDDNINTASAGVGVSADTWTLIAGGQKADRTLWVSVNGAPKVNGAASNLADPVATRLFLNLNDADGKADEALVWDAELSDTELEWLYNSGAGHTIAEIQAYSPGVAALPERLGHYGGNGRRRMVWP